MKWFFLSAAIACIVLVFGHVHQYVLFTAFGIAFLNFATFCLQYEEPANRARNRIEERLKKLKPGGLHADEQARLRADQPEILPQDRVITWNAMTMLNLATGIGGIVLCGWGILARMGYFPPAPEIL